MSGRTARAAGPWLAGAVLVAAVGLAVWLLWGETAPNASRAAPGVGETPVEPPQPGLLGARPDPSDPAAATPAGPARASSAPGAASRAPAVVSVQAPSPEQVALAPGQIPDAVREQARAPLAVSREELLGTVGAYGTREAPLGFAPRWLGVAHIVRTPEEGPADDVEAPVATGVTGKVLREDGSPAQGAEVILYSSFYLRHAYYDHRVREIGRVYTDAAGLFDMRPVDLDTVHFGSNGEVLVTVRHPHLPDLVAQRLDGLVPGKESDVGALVLPEAEAVVFGTIRDLQGAPVVGAVVRASGLMNPVDYDKTERMVVLSACPQAITDEQGRYRLTDLAPGRHEISVHVRLDCVVHGPGVWQGEREWSPRVRAGHGVRGRVLDPAGGPLANAVVRGGGNWTPTNPDGTFWLDNVDAGPLTLDVFHHAWAQLVVPDVPTDGEPVDLHMIRRLPRVTLVVVDGQGRPVPLVALTWQWAPGRGPSEFTPDSPHWHDPNGTFEVIVPEGAAGLRIERAAVGRVDVVLEELEDGRRLALELRPPEAEAPAGR